KRIKLNNAGDRVALIPQCEGKISNLVDHDYEESIDVAFPILHGPFGEDGTIQGLLKLADIPFVGAGVSGSAIGMDKDVMKRLLRDAKLPIGKFLVFREHEDFPDYQSIISELGSPVFVKPANMGSSVGVNKVGNDSEFRRALEDAFTYDTKVVIEEYIEGREMECSVLGNHDPIASVPGEVISNHDFYSYEAKYIDEKGALVKIPAELAEDTESRIKEIAIATFKTLLCEGLARVDLFLKDNEDIVINEINTMPGFTSISMYPKLWEASGMSYTELIDRLIQLAIERFHRERGIKSTYIGS
ncbi:MAG: D-alanine--D-alanine ligase, partial [Deltaproteobacteria bacterium]|nr:D-alanine--D-alanine ligase [Deltaproteobacteria bacterium]